MRILPDAAGLYYETFGPDDAPPLILSSGLGGSASYWAPNIPALARHFRVITYDHRGTGRSDRALPARVTVADLAADIVTLLDHLSIDSADIVGHAAGGVAGLAVAMDHPQRVRRVVIVNGWVKADPHFLRCFAARLALLRHAGVEAFLKAQPIFLFPANWISVHDAALDAELPHQIAGFPGTATMEKRIAALASFDATEQIGNLADKTLVLVADDDMLVPARAGDTLAKALGGAPVARMGWGGHACNVTDAATFDTLVLDYLRS